MGSAFLLHLVSLILPPHTPVALSPSLDGQFFYFIFIVPHPPKKQTTTTKPECSELRPELLVWSSPKEVVCASRVITLPLKILCRRGDNFHVVCATLRTCMFSVLSLFYIFRFDLCLFLCTFEKNSFQLSLSTKYMYSFQGYFSSLCIQGEGYPRAKGNSYNALCWKRNTAGAGRPGIELTCCCTGR